MSYCKRQKRARKNSKSDDKKNPLNFICRSQKKAAAASVLLQRALARAKILSSLKQRSKYTAAAHSHSHFFIPPLRSGHNHNIWLKFKLIGFFFAVGAMARLGWWWGVGEGVGSRSHRNVKPGQFAL
jgi:hypothetical protein